MNECKNLNIKVNSMNGSSFPLHKKTQAPHTTTKANLKLFKIYPERKNYLQYDYLYRLINIYGNDFTIQA